MGTWWLASYIVLWVVVIGVVLLLVEVLREIGMVRHARGSSSRASFTAPQDDGPSLGTRLPDLALNSVNGFGPVICGPVSGGRATLLMFLSPMCEGCQLVTEALNVVTEHESDRLAAVVVMRGGQESAVRAFLRVFPLNMPVVLDHGEVIISALDVHHAPFGLLYDRTGRLVRRGSVGNGNDLAALLGDTSVPEEALANVYPRPDGDTDRHGSHIIVPLAH